MELASRPISKQSPCEPREGPSVLHTGPTRVKVEIWIKRGKYIQKNCPSDARGSNSAAPSGNTSHVGEVQSHVKVLDPMPTGGRG